ncbi:hypothetical protein PoB_006262600 [Plakobranchus ocellatus]|uniref:Uncharacterized protein n=1 Tax=Plakobranchus ocellatus TaxID=259542 RepID=A0AAV4CWP4_9GAST|nr:hypothetical protein PoB_006262600 [Plakobranchus ocellatus]
MTTCSGRAGKSSNYDGSDDGSDGVGSDNGGVGSNYSGNGSAVDGGGSDGERKSLTIRETPLATHPLMSTVRDKRDATQALHVPTALRRFMQADDSSRHTVNKITIRVTQSGDCR